MSGIVELFRAGGVIMYPMLIVLVALATLTVVSVRRLHGGIAADTRVQSGIDAILLWSVFGVVLGLIGTLVGVAQAAEMVERFGRVETSIVWGGIRVALIPTIAGFLLFALAAPTWFYLRRAYRTRVS